MAAGAGAGSSQKRCVFVGNIPYDATEEQLVQICEEVGPVVSFRLVLDKDTGRPKGYGFCEYKDEETALSARRNLQGYEINGRHLRVDFASNGKDTDKNREQGRGGRGTGTTADAQQHPSGAFSQGDMSRHQPMGIGLAAAAASLMSGTLGGSQTSRGQTGLQVSHGSDSDPLTHYLARMSKHHLIGIISEMKSLAIQNWPLAKQLLERMPQLSKAIFQAEIMLGMVNPQMLQAVRKDQPASSSHPPFNLPNSFQQPDAAMPTYPTLPGKMAGNATQAPSDTSSLFRPSAQYQQLLQPAVKGLSQGQVLGTPGEVTYSSQQPAPFIPASQASLSAVGGVTHVRVPLMPQYLTPAGHANLQQPNLPHLQLPQAITSNVPLPIGGLEDFPKDVKTSVASHDPSWELNGAQSSYMRTLGQIGEQNLAQELNHVLKRRRLDDGLATAGLINSSDPTFPAISSQGQASSSLAPSAGQIFGATPMQLPDKQIPEFTPEVQSALLQQVMQLTPEQLRALPAEQQQQVIELQKMLSAAVQ